MCHPIAPARAGRSSTWPASCLVAHLIEDGSNYMLGRVTVSVEARIMGRGCPVERGGTEVVWSETDKSIPSDCNCFGPFRFGAKCEAGPAEPIRFLLQASAVRDHHSARCDQT